MARTLYGGRPGDFVAALFDLGRTGAGPMLLALPVDANGDPRTVTLEVYDTPGGTQLTDLLAADGVTPITEVVVPTTGQVPAFYAPDGYNTGVWVLDPEGDYYHLDIGPVGPAGEDGTDGTPGEVSTAEMNAAISAAIDALVDASPGTLDTLNELAAALGDDPNFAATITALVGTKLAKASNLSDLANASTARTNLGLGTAATTAAADYATSTGGGREKTAALSATTGTATGNLNNASIFTVTPTGNITLAFSNVPATGTACTVTVIVTQGGTVRTVTPPTGTKWMGAAAPTQVANKACAFSFVTVDGGSTWYASAAVEQ